MLIALPAIALCLTAFTMTAKAGIDSYEIYLNNKLLLRQVVSKSFTLQNLQLNQSNSNDQLVIHYTQCHGVIGKERSITLKDGKGKVIKEWKFANATSSNAGMVIPVKELLQLSKDHGNEPLSFYYNAQGYPEGQPLASFRVTSAIGVSAS